MSTIVYTATTVTLDNSSTVAFGDNWDAAFGAGLVSIATNVVGAAAWVSNSNSNLTLVNPLFVATYSVAGLVTAAVVTITFAVTATFAGMAFRRAPGNVNWDGQTGAVIVGAQTWTHDVTSDFAGLTIAGIGLSTQATAVGPYLLSNTPGGTSGTFSISSMTLTLTYTPTVAPLLRRYDNRADRQFAKLPLL